MQTIDKLKFFAKFWFLTPVTAKYKTDYEYNL